MNGQGHATVVHYFAYGSNMNPRRMAERGLEVVHAEAASLAGYRLLFDKHSTLHGGFVHSGLGHANVVRDPSGAVEGVLYRLGSDAEIFKMDPYERAPVNYSREVVRVTAARGPVVTWTYFANAAVRRSGLLPPRSYLDHLLAGERYLSPDYLRMLRDWPCVEDL